MTMMMMMMMKRVISIQSFSVYPIYM